MLCLYIKLKQCVTYEHTSIYKFWYFNISSIVNRSSDSVSLDFFSRRPAWWWGWRWGWGRRGRSTARALPPKLLPSRHTAPHRLRNRAHHHSVGRIPKPPVSGSPIGRLSDSRDSWRRDGLWNWWCDVCKPVSAVYGICCLSQTKLTEAKYLLFSLINQHNKEYIISLHLLAYHTRWEVSNEESKHK